TPLLQAKPTGRAGQLGRNHLMKRRGLRFPLVMCIIGSASIAGCFFPEKPATSIDSDWTTPLDNDLRAAAPQLETAMKTKGFKMDVQWLGARGHEYAIERNQLGEPVRKRVLVMYAYKIPSSGKCFLQGDGVLAQDVMLAREHLGGGH